jgi:hypothetical protein
MLKTTMVVVAVVVMMMMVMKHSCGTDYFNIVHLVIMIIKTDVIVK